MKRKFLYLSASLLLFACSNEGAAVDSTVEVEAMDTTEVVEEVVEYPEIKGSWIDDSVEDFIGVKFFEVSDDYARIAVTHTDNVIQGPIVKTDQTEDTLTLWVYEEKIDVFQYPESLTEIKVNYEEKNGDIHIQSDGDLLVPSHTTSADMGDYNSISESTPEYPVEKVEELRDKFDSYITMDQARELFETEVLQAEDSATVTHPGSNRIFFSDDGLPFYSFPYEEGEPMVELDFIVYAENGRTQKRKRSDKLYTFDNMGPEQKEENSSTDIISQYNDLPLRLKVLLAATTVDHRAMTQDLAGFILNYQFDGDFLYVRLTPGVGTGHPWYAVQYDTETITPHSGVVYSGMDGYEVAEVTARPVSKTELYQRYMDAKTSYDSAIMNVEEVDYMTTNDYNQMINEINQ